MPTRHMSRPWTQNPKPIHRAQRCRLSFNCAISHLATYLSIQLRIYHKLSLYHVGCHHCPSTRIARSQKLHGQRRRRFLAQAQYTEEPSGWSNRNVNRNVRQQGPIQPAVWNDISQFSSSSAEQSQSAPLRIDQTWAQRQNRYGYDSGTESRRQSAIARDNDATRRLDNGDFWARILPSHCLDNFYKNFVKCTIAWQCA